jgi:hypothetical protein
VLQRGPGALHPRVTAPRAIDDDDVEAFRIAVNDVDITSQIGFVPQGGIRRKAGPHLLEPALFILDADDGLGTTRPENGRIAGSILEDTLVAEIELFEELDGRIGVPRDCLAIAIDGLVAADRLEVAVAEPEDLRGVPRGAPVPGTQRGRRQVGPHLRPAQWLQRRPPSHAGGG